MLTRNKVFRDRRSGRLQYKRRKRKQKLNYINSQQSDDSLIKSRNIVVSRGYDYVIDFPKAFSFEKDLTGTIDFCKNIEAIK